MPAREHVPERRVSRSSRTNNGLSKSNYIDCHATAIIELSDPRGDNPEFTRSDPRIPEWLTNRLREFRFKNIVSVERSREEWIYEADESAYLEALDRVEDTEDTLPCGHTGFSNPADTDGYECRTYQISYIRAVLEAAFD